MSKKFILVYFLLIAINFVAQENEVTIDFTTQKFIGEESELKRPKYFAMHDSYTSWDLASDAEYLYKNLGVEYGRLFGGPAPFRKSKTELQSISEAEGRAKWSNANIKKSPLFKEFGTADFVITDHPGAAFQYNFKDYDKIAAYNVAFLKNAYPITPKYYEVMNEPFVHSKDYVKTWKETPAVIVEMCKLYKAVADKVHKEIPDMQVGGYAAAYPEVEKDNFEHWNTRMKTFMDIAGESMQFFATHIYDGRNVQGDFTLRSGSNSEAILDLIEAYSYKKWKVVKPHLISEYGFTAQGLVGKPFSPALNGTCLISYNNFLMQFLDKPDRMVKAIPFITAKATWFYNDKNPDGHPYPWVIKKKEKDGSYTFTHLKKFYEFWKGVEGKRTEVASNNPDIQIHSFLKKGKSFVAINNLTDLDQEVKVSFLNNSDNYIKNITLRRLYTTSTGLPRLVFYTNLKSLESVSLKPGETIIAECDINDFEFKGSIKEQNFYTDVYLQTIEKNKNLSFTFNDLPKVKNGRASLKMGIARNHDLSKKPKITVNGNIIEIPSNWAGYDQASRKLFFGVIGVPFNVKHLKVGENVVDITFPDAGGHLSSLILNVENKQN